jgi:SH3-like domain-containing protein
MISVEALPSQNNNGGLPLTQVSSIQSAVKMAGIPNENELGPGEIGERTAVRFMSLKPILPVTYQQHSYGWRRIRYHAGEHKLRASIATAPPRS